MPTNLPTYRAASPVRIPVRTPVRIPVRIPARIPARIPVRGVCLLASRASCSELTANSLRAVGGQEPMTRQVVSESV